MADEQFSNESSPHTYQTIEATSTYAAETRHALRRARAVVLATVLLAAVLAVGDASRNAVLSGWLTNRGNFHLIRERQRWDVMAPLPRCAVWEENSSARSFFERALLYNPTNERAMVGLGRAVWLEGDCSKAEEYWKQVLTLDSSDIAARWEIANAQFVSGDTADAMARYEGLGAGPFFLLQGTKAEANGDFSTAMRWYQMSVELEPTRASVQALATKYLNVTNQPEEAQRLWLDFAGRTPPDDPDHWWALGQAAEVQQDWSTALSYYDRAIELQTHPYLLYLLYEQAGMISMQVPDYPRSEAYLRQALSLRPEDLLTHLRLGELEQHRQHYEAARSWYRRAAGFDPASELPQYYLGLSYFEAGDKLRARQAFLEADQLNSRNASVKFYLGLSSYGAGELSTAISLLEQAVTLYSGTPIGWLRVLVEWYLQAGRCADALAAAQHILTLQPDDVDIQALLQKTRETCP